MNKLISLKTFTTHSLYYSENLSKGISKSIYKGKISFYLSQKYYNHNTHMNHVNLNKIKTSKVKYTINQTDTEKNIKINSCNNKSIDSCTNSDIITNTNNLNILKLIKHILISKKLKYAAIISEILSIKNRDNLRKIYYNPITIIYTFLMIILTLLFICTSRKISENKFYELLELGNIVEIIVYTYNNTDESKDESMKNNNKEEKNVSENSNLTKTLTQVYAYNKIFNLGYFEIEDKKHLYDSIKDNYIERYKEDNENIDEIEYKKYLELCNIKEVDKKPKAYNFTCMLIMIILNCSYRFYTYKTMKAIFKNYFK